MSAVLALSAAAIAVAPNCPLHHAGDLVVAKAEEVPLCLETVDGDLIVGTGAEAVRFPRLTDVTGRIHLTVAGEGLVSAPQLERAHRGVEMQLRGRARVDLPALAHVHGALGLDLDRARSTTLLPALTRHDAGLWIFGGGGLKSVLPNLESVSGTVFIQPSAAIQGLLPGLARIGGHLVISNGSHVSTAGFSKLQIVEGGVYLFGGQALALPALRRISGALAVRDAMVRDLSGVGINGAEVGALLLRDNPQLEEWPSHLSVDPNRVQVRGTPLLAGKAPSPTQKARTRNEATSRRPSASASEPASMP